MLEHRFAQLAACCTFLLLIIGGMVNATGSSLACTEPTLICKGQILPEMTGGVLYEHGHRLAAMTVGLVQIVLSALLLLRREEEMKHWAAASYLMVIAQGALGAITVAFKLPWFVSTAHLLLAMSYFATLVYIAWRTRPYAGAAQDLGPTRRWIWAAVGAVAVQILLGGLVRHSEATLACIGMPTCTLDGQWFPDALTQRVHMIHRTWGCLTALITILAAIQVYRRAAGWTSLRRLMMLAPVLVLTQVTLGIYVVLTYRAVPIAVAHFAGAVSLWALWFTAWLWTGKRARADVEAHHPELAPVAGVHAVP
jgi:heme A synthase